MNKIFYAISISICAAFISCSKQTQNMNVKEGQQEIAILSYNSQESLKEAIRNSDSSITKVYDMGILNLFTPLHEYDYLSDPILSYEYATYVNGDIEEQQPVYRVFGYDELIPNENFAKLLNIRGEIRVGSRIYKISPKGTYSFPESMHQQFLENYHVYEMNEGKQIDEKTYEVAPSIIRYNTFEESESSAVVYEGKDAENSCGTKALPSFNWSQYPTYSGAASDYLDNQIFIYNMPNRRMKTRVYHHNYLVYQERGAYVKCERGYTFGWRDAVSQNLALTWNNIIMQGAHNPTEMVPPSGSYMGYTTEQVTYEGVNVNMIVIRGYVIPSNSINSVVTGGKATLRALILNAVNVDINNYSIVRLVGHDYVQVVFLGTWNRFDSNVYEVKKVFTDDWFTGIPAFVGGQFMYAALADNGDFGAMRVGTAF